MPVTTTNERKMSAVARLCAITVWSYVFAWSQLTLTHCNEKPISKMVNTAQGRRRRHAGSPAR